MIGDIQLSAQLTFNKISDPRQAPFTLGETGLQLNVTGKYRQDGIRTIGTSISVTPDMGDLNYIGFLALKNLGAALIDAPAAPVVTNVGTTGTTHYEYGISALQADGHYTAVAYFTMTTTGNATLSGSNYNHVTWDAVDNAVSYNVWLSATTGTATTGFLANVTTLTYDHKVPTLGDGSSYPSPSPYDFDIKYSLDGTNWFGHLRGGESHVLRLYLASELYLLAINNPTDVAYLMCDR